MIKFLFPLHILIESKKNRGRNFSKSYQIFFTNLRTEQSQ
jgi:hypothetical protein